jgi:hypothetical protein
MKIFKKPARKVKGFWDFKSYDEKTWFRYVICFMTIIVFLYIGTHFRLNNRSYNYEYYRLNQDQVQFISRVLNENYTSDTASKGHSVSRDSVTKVKVKTTTDSLKRIKVALSVMDYLNNIFDDSIERGQYKQVLTFLIDNNPQLAISCLNDTRFKVHSYFWLIGPAVYWEIVFWVILGVICNILFVLGDVGSNSTTDLANPETQFDPSKLMSQVAKIFYAPVCTLAVVMGYNFINGRNIVDIDSSKGLLVFGFIAGFYSSRVISLMDRIKDVLLPNSGASSLSSNNPPTMIPQVKVALSIDADVHEDIAKAAAGMGLNKASVKLVMAGTTNEIKGYPVSDGPDGIFTFDSVNTGHYTISAVLQVSTAGSAEPVTLKGSVTGSILSGTSPIQLSIK